MVNIFDINTVLFTVWGYQMSYIEFFGTIFNLWCVWLTAKNKILCWPVGIVGVVFYMFLFYQIQLYSDLVEQVYFLVTSFYGWFLWLNLSKAKGEKDKDKRLKISRNTLKTNLVYGAIIIFGTLGMGYFMGNIHTYMPKFFSEPASYPYLDAFTTVLSFAAMILLAKKRVESWYLWILVDIIGVGLYYVKGVKFIAAEYFIFLIMATKGLISWQRQFKNYKEYPLQSRVSDSIVSQSVSRRTRH
ncbi:nicotinamide riboside transporter PnuC [Candidatus Parcubacteria bacterium]|nr:nicotinamide riboside transporter PnuC [Candidatus Parcubacteria bacterium]